jgi:hypothetical protein
VRDLIERLRQYPTLRDAAARHDWDFGEGYIAGKKGISRPAEHLIGKRLLPTEALSEAGINANLLQTVPDQPIKDPKTAKRFTPPFLLIKENEDLHHGIWQGDYLTYKHRIMGIAAKKHDLARLQAIEAWLRKEQTVLRAYVAVVSASLFVQRTSAILQADILALPYPDDEDLDLSENERIVAEDIVDYQREFIRRGTGSAMMRVAPNEALSTFDDTFTRQINTIYTRKPLRALGRYNWAGAICGAYGFGDGVVDWSDAKALQTKLDALLQERRGSTLTITRITRLYDQGFVFLLKPDRHRFWTRSIALRDADDVLADLRGQGF